MSLACGHVDEYHAPYVARSIQCRAAGQRQHADKIPWPTPSRCSVAELAQRQALVGLTAEREIALWSCRQLVLATEPMNDSVQAAFAEERHQHDDEGNCPWGASRDACLSEREGKKGISHHCRLGHDLSPHSKRPNSATYMLEHCVERTRPLVGVRDRH
jgi:hypothetical protein